MKTTTQPSHPPIVCDLSVFTPEERKHHIDESSDLFNNAKSISEVSNGFTFHYDYSEKMLFRLADWMKDDTKCCSFLTFELAIEPFPAGKAVILRVMGKEGIKESIREDLRQMGIKV